MEETVRETWNLMIEVVMTYGLDVVGAILILIVGWWIAGRSRGWAKMALERTGRVDAMLTGFLAAAVRYTVLALTVLAVLDRFGVETTSFVAILGATGIAIGLALQGTLSNVAAGVMILVLRPFKVGDFIEGGRPQRNGEGGLAIRHPHRDARQRRHHSAQHPALEYGHQELQLPFNAPARSRVRHRLRR